MEGFYQGFGARLHQLRRSSGLTQEQLARRLGINRTTLVNIEKGRQRVAVHQLVEFAQVLGCDPVDLLPPRGLAYDRVDTAAGPDGEAADFVIMVQAKRAASRR